MSNLIIFFLVIWSLTSYGQDESQKNSKSPDIIRFSHVVKRETPKGIGAQMFKRLVNNNDKLNQQFRVEVYPEGVLYDDEKVIDALLANKVQLAAPSLSVLCKRQSDFFCRFDEFYKFKDVKAVDDFQKSDEGQRLLKEEVIGKICSADKTNCLIGLFYWHNGMKQLSTTKACPEDKCFFMKEGLTFRIQDSATIKEKFEHLFKGAKTKYIPFRKTRKSLADGEVDGQENTWSNILAEEYNQIQNCFIETNHGYLGYLVLTNQKFWNGLEDPVREDLKIILTEITSKVNEITNKYNKESYEQLKKEGKKFISLTQANLKDCPKSNLTTP
jgi:C4-dicarboxylate-binding protein DctP